MSSKTPFNIVVLAAGEGTRMKSDLPKVLQPVCGEPILVHVLERIAEACPGANVGVVVGYQREKVETAISSHSVSKKIKVSFIFQKERKGTGDAARVTMESEYGKKALTSGAPVLILPGDFPLMSEGLVSAMTVALQPNEKVHVLTGVLDDPSGYGRFLRSSNGEPIGIVEEKDATEAEKKVNEVGTSIYAFDAQFLVDGLKRINTNNAQGEFYLPDLVKLATSKPEGAKVTVWKNQDDVRGCEQSVGTRSYSKKFEPENSPELGRKGRANF